MSYGSPYYGGECIPVPISNSAGQFDITLYVKDEGIATIFTNRDYSATEIYISIANQEGEELLHIADTDITKTSDRITFSIVPLLVSIHNKLNYAIRVVEGNKASQKGNILIEYAAYSQP